mgnify:FL=1
MDSSIAKVLEQLGIVGVIAESFEGMGMRKCINVGLPLLVCAGIIHPFGEGDGRRLAPGRSQGAT